ncbi:MAG TPA: CHAP domain-containing protein [Candidatus Dormibacteraeota bacterium]|nr:CHAP domain-containing protein [Candidatus Dormibacteraeota bacterium]
MSPQRPHLTVLARVLATATAAVLVPLAVPTAAGADFVPWGTVLVPTSQWVSPEVAELGNFNVYSNGTGSQDQSSTYGLAYECVELAQRFAAVRYGEQKVWPISYAYQMWDAAPTLSIPLLQLPNGGAQPPQTGDLLIFNHSTAAPFGHVAVVADTGPGYVDIVEQNWGNSSPTGTARLPIDGTTMPDRSGVPIIGWLRSSTSALPFKPTLITQSGLVYPVAGASNFGGPVSLALASPIVGAAGTPDGKGYWMVGSDGGIFSYGDAQFYGTTAGTKLNAPVIGMTATHDGKGYWLVAADGGIFSFGDARFYGSTGGMKLNAPVVGMAPTPDGNGYWMVASDGGIFSFGDAQFWGSTGGMRLNKPVNGMAPTATGNGYWLVASDGGIFSFGDARFFGSAGGIQVPSPVVRMTASSDGNGYWLATSGGSVYAYGDARFFANSGVVGTASPVVGMVATVAQQ